MTSMYMKHIAKRYGWIVVLAILVGGGSSAYFTQREPFLYEAVTTVVVGPSDRVGNTDTALRGLDTVSRRNVMATYAQIPASRTIREGTRNKLTLSPQQARAYRVRTSILPDTNVLRITVQGPDAQGAADFANIVVLQSQQLIPKFYDGIVSFKVLDEAVRPGNPIELGIARKAALGALLGLLLSVCLAFLIERFYYGHVYAPVPATPIIEEGL